MIIIDAVIAVPSLWAPGPVGLFQVFDLGPPDLRAHVIDSMPHIGGQGVELCPDKPVHDIPALWRVQPRGAWLCADPRPSLPGPAIC